MLAGKECNGVEDRRTISGVYIGIQRIQRQHFDLGKIVFSGGDDSVEGGDDFGALLVSTKSND